ncbi:hypothetical protein [Streptomyces sp. NPDC050485]|uniref:hypothetical protein n=1 Tax=Streptomyces sp. NPDC050485 TaxID=3365617 RepID=UPI00378B4EAA
MADKEQQPTDAERVDLQVSVRDMSTNMSKAVSSLPAVGNARPAGRTDFEGHQLNDMIDLVHNANPEHLTSAGEALWAARDAIEKAAEELNIHVDYVDWEGESGKAFRTWGQGLVAKTRQLADFADTAGIQISVAGTGLASVSKAMPPRDHRTEPVKVTDIPPTKRVAGNASYDAAVRVEKDRQEAINQMNRLSSFYSVSEQNLAAQTPPVFEPMPEMGVPAPRDNFRIGDPSITQPSSGGRRSVDAATSRHGAADGAIGHSRMEKTVNSAHQGDVAGVPSIPVIDRPVGTELNTVTAPPAPAPAPSQGGAIPAPPISTGPGGGPVPPLVNGLVSPTVSGSAKAFGAVRGLGAPTQSPAGPTGVARRGANDPLGRAGSAAQGVGNSGAASVNQSPIGQGVSGGTPRAGGAPSRAGAGATARGNGIVGGRPGIGTPGPTGSRMPRGTVVGGAGGMPSNSTSRPGQRGVVGAPKTPSSSGVQTNRRPLSNADGVVGTPQNRSASTRGSRKGFTTGGSGLVRTLGDQSGAEPDDETNQSPQHTLEGSEVEAPDRRNYLPPAIN